MVSLGYVCLLLLFVHICCLLVNYSYFYMIKNQFAIKVTAAWSLGCFDRRQDLLKTSLPVFLPRKGLQVKKVASWELVHVEERRRLIFICVKKMIVNFIINTFLHLNINTIINIQKTFNKHVNRDEEETAEEAIGLSHGRVQLRPHAALRNL